MTTVLGQFVNLQRLIDERREDMTLVQSDELDARVDLVTRAIGDDSRVRGFWDADDCQDFMEGQAAGSLSANAGFWLACRDWEYNVTNSLDHLAEYLDGVGLPELADVSKSLGGRVAGAGDISDDVVPDTFGEWWENLPTWAKAGIPLTIVALLVYTPWAAGVASKAAK